MNKIKSTLFFIVLLIVTTAQAQSYEFGDKILKVNKTMRGV